MTVCPTVTWPSPAITTRPRWRTQRMVVPWISGARVGTIVGLHEPAQIDVRVALRRRQARVAEHLLDGAQVGAAAEEVRGEGVAERVRGGLGGGAGDEDVALEIARHAPRGEAAAARVPEDRPR